MADRFGVNQKVEIGVVPIAYFGGIVNLHDMPAERENDANVTVS